MYTKNRTTFAPDGTAIQGSLMQDPGDYVAMNLHTLMLGIIIDVHPCDSPSNRSSQQADDRQGFRHECTVLIMNDGGSSYTFLEHVVIPPSQASGLDDYEEKLPRGSSVLVDGSEIDSSLQEIDPYSLDGDWCVVGFIGGRLDYPCIISWFPHCRNTYDPATSGVAFGERALDQDRRYFRRIRGVETVITTKGDVIFSTTFANSRLAPGVGNSPMKGRFARDEEPDVGGSVRLNIKTSQALEVTWNEPEEGIGAVNKTEPDLPQTNPPPTEPSASGEYDDTYIYIDRDQIDFIVPSSIIYHAGDLLEMDAEKIKLGIDAGDDPVVLGEQLRNWLQNEMKILSPFGPLMVDPTTVIVGSPYDDTQSEKSFVE